MTDAGRTEYDHVFYPGHPFAQTHPERLATIASLFGMQPAPVDRCRVLELGCGIGGNLVPMAYQLPDSEFLGIDLSESAIAKGVSNVARLGLTNIELRRADIMEVTPAFGRFDYIIAHGVYSWVPPTVRARMLSIFKQNLNPRGVAYVSYNAYPGSHFRDLTREMMLHHVQGMDNPKERIAQGRALLASLAAATADNTAYGVVIRDQLERVKATPDEVIYHDDLNAAAEAFYVRQVAADAARAGLQYISEATFAHTSLGGHAEPVMEVIRQIPASEFVQREQYLDFFVGRGFRETLLCHADIALDRNVGPQRLKRYHVVAFTQPELAEADPAAPGVVSFKTEKGSAIATDHRLSKAALLYLSENWPQAVGFPELLERSLARLGSAAAPIRANLDEEVDTLLDVLFRAVCRNHIELHLYPPRLTTMISERPTASLLARREAENATFVTSLRHALVRLEDTTVRHFLLLVDGTRNVDALVSDLNAVLAAAQDRATEGGTTDGAPPARPEVNRGRVEESLKVLARLGLLIA